MATHSSILAQTFPWTEEGAWWATTVHGVTKSWTRLNDEHYELQGWKNVDLFTRKICKINTNLLYLQNRYQPTYHTVDWIFSDSSCMGLSLKEKKNLFFYELMQFGIAKLIVAAEVSVYWPWHCMLYHIEIYLTLANVGHIHSTSFYLTEGLHLLHRIVFFLRSCDFLFIYFWLCCVFIAARTAL